nr:hypothetical protein [Tanacetum cinerariifolium]
MPTPPPSPVTSLSSPSAGEHLARCTTQFACPSPPPMPSPLLPSSRCPTQIQTLKMTSTQALIDAVTTSHHYHHLYTYHHLFTVGMIFPRLRCHLVRGIREVGYGIRDTWVDPAEAVPEIAPMTLGEMQQTEKAKLRKTDHRHQAQMVETSRVMGDMRREMGDMQAELLALRERIMAPVSRQGPNIPPNNTNPNNMTPKSVQAMIDQALLRNSTNGDGSHILKKKMTDKYCPQGEIKKLEIKLWNLKVKGNDVPAYTKRFQELTLICTKFVANETEKTNKYICGLPDNIYGSAKASKPKTLDETIELASDMMDLKHRTYAERQTNNKRKADDSFRSNYGHQQQPTKRQNITKIYNIGSGERKPVTTVNF